MSIGVRISLSRDSPTDTLPDTGKFLIEINTLLREITCPYVITQCYLSPGIGDFPAFTPAEADNRFSDPAGMQGWVDLGGGYIPR